MVRRWCFEFGIMLMITIMMMSSPGCVWANSWEDCGTLPQTMPPIPSTCVEEPESTPPSALRDPDFRLRLARTNVPVVIRGGLGKEGLGWGADGWTWESVGASLGSRRMDGVWTREEGEYHAFARVATQGMDREDEEWWGEVSGGRVVFDSFDKVTLRGKEMCDELGSEHTLEGTRKRLLYHHLTRDGLARDLKAGLEPMENLVYEDGDANVSVWFSSRGVVAHPHWDRNHNVFVQILGSKRITLIAPKDLDAVHPFPTLHASWAQAQVDLLAPNVTQFPRVEELEGKCMAITLQAGDLLFIPPYTLHHVHTLEASLSVSHHSYSPAIWADRAAVKDAYKAPIPVQPEWERPKLVAGLFLFLEAVIEAAEVEDPTPAAFVANLLSTRYAPLLSTSLPTPDPSLCPGHHRVMIELEDGEREGLEEGGAVVGGILRSLEYARRQYVGAYVEEVVRMVCPETPSSGMPGMECVVSLLSHCFVSSP